MENLIVHIEATAQEAGIGIPAYREPKAHMAKKNRELKADMGKAIRLCYKGYYGDYNREMEVGMRKGVDLVEKYKIFWYKMSKTNRKDFFIN